MRGEERGNGKAIRFIPGCFLHFQTRLCALVIPRH